MMHRQWHHRVFVAYVAIMLLAFLLPVPITSPTEQGDKLVHFGMFLGFALLFWLDQRRSAWCVFLISVLFAGGIELVQWMVLAAGAVGAGLGTILVLRQVRRLSDQRGM